MKAEQILADYKRDGVVRLHQFFSPDEVKRVRQELEKYTRDIAPSLAANEVIFEADGKSARNLWRMEQHSPFFEIGRAHV